MEEKMEGKNFFLTVSRSFLQTEVFSRLGRNLELFEEVWEKLLSGVCRRNEEEADNRCIRLILERASQLPANIGFASAVEALQRETGVGEVVERVTEPSSWYTELREQQLRRELTGLKQFLEPQVGDSSLYLNMLVSRLAKLTIRDCDILLSRLGDLGWKLNEMATAVRVIERERHEVQRGFLDKIRNGEAIDLDSVKQDIFVTEQKLVEVTEQRLITRRFASREELCEATRSICRGDFSPSDDLIREYGPLQFWDVTLIPDLSSLFEGCMKLNANMSGWKIAEEANMRDMFKGSSMEEKHKPRKNVMRDSSVMALSRVFTHDIPNQFHNLLNGNTVVDLFDMLDFLLGDYHIKPLDFKDRSLRETLLNCQSFVLTKAALNVGKLALVELEPKQSRRDLNAPVLNREGFLVPEPLSARLLLETSHLPESSSNEEVALLQRVQSIFESQLLGPGYASFENLVNSLTFLMQKTPSHLATAVTLSLWLESVELISSLNLDESLPLARSHRSTDNVHLPPLMGNILALDVLPVLEEVNNWHEKLQSGASLDEVDAWIASRGSADSEDVQLLSGHHWNYIKCPGIRRGVLLLI